METLEQITPKTEKAPVQRAAPPMSLPVLRPVTTRWLSFAEQCRSFENARYGWMAILLTVQSCLGAIACMFILKNDASIYVLATCSAITMGSNAMFIGLASPRVCLVALYLSVVLNTAFILLNI